MNVKTISISRRAGVVASSLVALAAALPLTANAVEQAGTLAAESNFIKLSAQNSWVDGSKSAWQTELRHTKSVAGGIEELKIDQKINDKDTLQFDARILPGDDDYLGLIRLKVEETATVEVGYKQYRTYYDGVGGFFPTNGAWKTLANQFLHTDRSNFWIDTRIALPDRPVIHVRYSNERRTGQKDTTSWGDTYDTGLQVLPAAIATATTPGYYAPTQSNNPLRKLVANAIDLDEQQQTFAADVQHTIGKTKLTFSAVGTFVSNADTRGIERNPGELQTLTKDATNKIFPLTANVLPVWSALPSKGGVPTYLPLNTVSPQTKLANHTNGWDKQGIDTQTWAFTGKFETALNEKVTLFGGVTHSLTKGTYLTDREYSTDIPIYSATAPYAVTVLNGIAYVNSGALPKSTNFWTNTDSSLKQEITAGNLGLNIRPFSGMFVTAALKAERSSVQANNTLVTMGTIVNQYTGAQSAAGSNTYVSSCDNSENAWVPELSARYNGIRTVSLYGEANYRYTPGTESSNFRGTAVSDKACENHGNYKLGVSWNPAPIVTLRAETFLKNHENRIGDYTAASEFYLFNSRMKGAVLSASVTPIPELSSTTRYTVRSGTTDVIVDSAPGSSRASTSKTHEISESLSWTPNKDYYVQVDMGYVFDTTGTAHDTAGNVTTNVASTSTSNNTLGMITRTFAFASQAIANADNNYWTGSAVAGVNVDSSTSVEVKYAIYHSDNFIPALAAYGIPLGMSEKNSSITLGVKHKFSEKLAAEARVGYFESVNATSGGNSNYDGVLAYVGVTHAF